MTTKITEKKVNFQIQESYFLPKEIKQSILQKKEADMQDTGLKQTMDDLDMARSLGDSVG